MKKLCVGESLSGVKSESFRKKNPLGFKVSHSRLYPDKTYKAEWFKIWMPREGKPVTLASGEDIWLGDTWEIYANNASYLLDNWNGVDELVCTRIYQVREVTRKSKEGKWELGRTMQINCDLLPKPDYDALVAKMGQK